MKKILFIAIVLFASCKKEPLKQKETITCTDEQRQRMTEAVYRQVDNRTDLTPAGRETLKNALYKEALRTYCTIKTN